MINWKDLKRLLKIMDKDKLAELTIEDGETKITLKKSQPTVFQSVVAQPAQIPVNMEQNRVAKKSQEVTMQEQPQNIYEVKSPLVGTFYRSPKPGASPFVNIKEKINKGQTLCIIEAMKVMNEIKSEVDGTLLEICAKDGEPVDFGRVIFKIELIG